MASRKEQKEQARARRLAEEQARALRARRDRRLRMVGGAVLIACVLIGVAIAVSSSGGSGATGLLSAKKAGPTEKLVDSELAGIPQSGATLGNPNAPVTMIYYGDLQCPVCAAFTTGASGGGLPQLIANEVKQGKVKVEYRPTCTATCHYANGQSVFNTQQVAALAAGLQNRFWNYAELFYHEQGAEGSGYVNSSFLNGIASQVPGLDLNKWQSDQGNSSLLSQVQQGESQAQAQSVLGTPAVFMIGPKGQKMVNAATGIPSYSELTSTIAQVE